MAAVVINCPACTKKFKGKESLVNKRIKCPLCATPFVVTPDHIKQAKAQAKDSAPLKMQQDKPSAAKGNQRVTWTKEDEDSTAYQLGEFDLRARCPNCANLMEGDEAVVCIYCGYNTQTRTWGTTVRTTAITGGQHVIHLLPGLIFCFLLICFIVGTVFLCVDLPPMVVNTWAWFIDHESIRMWIIAIALGFMWAFGVLTVKRLVLNPRPTEIEKQATARNK